MAEFCGRSPTLPPNILWTAAGWRMLSPRMRIAYTAPFAKPICHCGDGTISCDAAVAGAASVLARAGWYGADLWDGRLLVKRRRIAGSIDRKTLKYPRPWVPPRRNLHRRRSVCCWLRLSADQIKSIAVPKVSFPGGSRNPESASVVMTWRRCAPGSEEEANPTEQEEDPATACCASASSCSAVSNSSDTLERCARCFSNCSSAVCFLILSSATLRTATSRRCPGDRACPAWRRSSAI